MAASLPGDPKPLGSANQGPVAPVVSVIQGAPQSHSQKCCCSGIASGTRQAADGDSVLENHDGSAPWLVLPFFAAMPPVARVALVVAFPEVHDPSAVEVHGALISTDAVRGRELDFCRWSDLAGLGARIGVLLLRHRRWRQQQWSSNERKDSGFHRRSNGRQPFLSMLSATESMATGMSPQQ